MLPEFFAFHGRPFFSGETEPCINGRIVAAGAYFGANVAGLVERLLGEQMADGGWNCEQENGAIRGSFGTTINVLEGLLLYERAAVGAGGAAVADVASARRRGEEYLLERRLFRRLSTGELSSRLSAFAFPPDTTTTCCVRWTTSDRRWNAGSATWARQSHCCRQTPRGWQVATGCRSPRRRRAFVWRSRWPAVALDHPACPPRPALDLITHIMVVRTRT